MHHAVLEHEGISIVFSEDGKIVIKTFDHRIAQAIRDFRKAVIGWDSRIETSKTYTFLHLYKREKPKE